MNDFLERHIESLLHIDEATKNKLIDLDAGDKSKTYYLSCPYGDTGEYALATITNRKGRVGNTVLRDSALVSEQTVGARVNSFDWKNANGEKDAVALNGFIDGIYKELRLKGNNSLFLCVGALRWKISVSVDCVKDVLSPLLIFPIRLVRSTSVTPVCIEFVDDDAYFNPCLIRKIEQVYGKEVADRFPHPNGYGQFGMPLNCDGLGDGKEYFNSVAGYVEKLSSGDVNRAVFSLEKDVVAIAHYNHDELCMYYDITRNLDAIYGHSLVRRAFCEGISRSSAEIKVEPRFVLSRDSVQEEMVRRVVNGESLIIKGPPGTGKTQTIANMLAALLSEGKKVLLSSKKLAALSEVYAKLPDRIRKFTMLLDAETEAQAAKVNPLNIKKDFGRLLDEKRNYSLLSDADKKRDAAIKEKTQSTEFLLEYLDVMFGKTPILEDNYYTALNVFLNDEELPKIEFDSPREAIRLKRAEYDALISTVKDCGIYYDALTAKRKRSIKQSPWFGVHNTADPEGAYLRYGTIASQAKEILSRLSGVFDNADLSTADIGISDIAALTEEESICKEDIEKILSAGFSSERFTGVTAALGNYLTVKNPECEKKISEFDFQKAECLLSDGHVLTLDRSLSKNAIAVLIANKELIKSAEGILSNPEFIDKLNGYVDEINGYEKEQAASLAEVGKIFSDAAIEEHIGLFEKASAALDGYSSENKQPKFFDFKAKSICKKLKPLSYLSDVSFSEVVTAVKAFVAATKKKAEIESCKRVINQIFRRKFEDVQIDALFLLLKLSKASGVQAMEYFSSLESSYGLLNSLFAFAKDDNGYTVGELLDGISAKLKLYELKSALEGYFAEAGASATLAVTRPEAIARYVCAMQIVSENGLISVGTYAERANRIFVLREIDISTKELLRSLPEELKAFGVEHFSNYYTASDNLKLKDLSVLIKDAVDRNILSAALEYSKAVYVQQHRLSLNKFFAYFENGNYDGDAALEDIFEHSFYALALSAYTDLIGNKRNGLGKNVVHMLSDFSAAEDEIAEADCVITERRCMSRIDANDFAFLAAERDSIPSLRYFFKKYASEILKLTSCFILSPSTASVLFRPNEYSNFDVVIIDEASQLEPVCLLPLLFRAKQCVIVGDEWQMPPIKHFTAKRVNEVTVTEGDETFVLEPEASALTLALKNGNFAFKELQCHYRSKTESLIAFSQRRFYPHMRTFPAAVPYDEGLGFTDIYVEDGRCEKGVNTAEAECVVKKINEHFDRYYDAEKGLLKASVGVVAFGEEQIKAISGLVEKDGKLSEKIRKALMHFDDMPEKLIFFKTIETVQGQETQHLILSVTYGRTADGKITNNFGQLNRDKLGQCIFNVAVTRAQSSITVIHSVLPSDITSENVSYIKEYLTVAQRFGNGGRDQFVSRDTDLGFLKSVANYVRSCGIEENRIVFNYGVTDGSVKIPIVILSKDLRCAQLGIWCETPFTKSQNYLDYNMRYVASLIARGWNVHRIYVHDWVDNAASEKESLKKVLNEFVK